MGNLLIQSDVVSEFLSNDEIQELTGASQLKRQIDWLKKREWQFELNHRNQIKISRWYLRLKMSGLTSSTFSIDATAEPNFAAIR